MKIVAADWLPYALRLKRPWQAGCGALNELHGSLLRLRTADGLTGWGDAAPLPEFGITEPAARAFAEECAHLDLLAQQAGLPLGQWLSGNAPIGELAINANLGTLAALEPEMLATAASQGFSVVKLKVGQTPVQHEIALLRQKLLAAPVRVRLDANRGWSMTDAADFIVQCAGLPIEWLEEPLAEPDTQSLAELQSRCDFPLAIDESTALIDDAFFRHPPVRRLVIKPAREGGLLTSIERALRAKASGLEVIVTTSLESACGLLACAHLAAAIAPDAIHGLGTADWFADDTGLPPAVAAGRLRLPGASGLGFQPIAQ